MAFTPRIVLVNFLLLFIIPPYSNSEKILVLSFSGSKSHKNAYDPLYLELGKRGHQVTVIHPVKSNYNHGNMREINGEDFDTLMEKKKKEGTAADPPPNPFDWRMKGLSISTPIVPFLIPILQEVCATYYEMPEVMEGVLKERWDLVFVQTHMNECTYGFLHHLNTSFIFTVPHAVEHYKAVLTGLRYPPSFVPTYALGSVTDDLSFYERTLNFIAYQVLNILYDWIYLPRMESFYRKYMGDHTPSIREIEQNASLILNNAHFTLGYPRPQLPQIIDVPCLHCAPGKPLEDPDLLKFINSSSSREGFIFFSLGSIAKGSQMPEHVMSSFVQAFSKIRQKVVWKIDLDKIPGLTENVKLVRWAPQQDLLAHKNIKMFISHGGLLSTEEAMYHGVPLIGMPIYGDQHDFNLHMAKNKGYGILLELKDITADKVLTAINAILSNKRYSESARHLSKLLKDQPSTSLESGVYWTEYILRHKGAPHLRSPAAKLNFLAYHSLDVVAFLILMLMMLVLINYKLMRFCCSCLRRGKSSSSGTKTKVSSSPIRQSPRLSNKKNN